MELRFETIEVEFCGARSGGIGHARLSGTQLGRWNIEATTRATMLRGTRRCASSARRLRKPETTRGLPLARAAKPYVDACHFLGRLGTPARLGRHAGDLLPFRQRGAGAEAGDVDAVRAQLFGDGAGEEHVEAFAGGIGAEISDGLESGGGGHDQNVASPRSTMGGANRRLRSSTAVIFTCASSSSRRRSIFQNSPTLPKPALLIEDADGQAVSSSV